MRFGIHTLDDFDFMGKTVLVRVDINQPIDRKNNTLKSINRIKACLPTISELSDKQAKVVLLAHQGSDIEYQNFCSITPHAKVLSELLKRPREAVGRTMCEAAQAAQTVVRIVCGIGQKIK